MTTTMPKNAIIYVDDDPAVCQVMGYMLQSMWDNPIVTLPGGQAAIDYLAALPPEELPHVVFVDLHMADVNGIDVVKWIRERYRDQASPVTVIVTGDDERTAIQQASDCGAMYYVVKPPTKEGLFAIIRREHTLSNVLMRQTRKEHTYGSVSDALPAHPGSLDRGLPPSAHERANAL